MQCCICACNILCYVYGICSFSDADLGVRNFFCVRNFFMHAINCIVGRENDVICPIVTIVVIGVVICGYVRGIPTLRHQCISWSWHAAYEALLRCDHCSLDVLNDVWKASYSDIQSERPLQSMMVTSLPPTEPSHNAIYCMHIHFLHTLIQWSHAR
jgi:hypothetical protein